MDRLLLVRHGLPEQDRVLTVPNYLEFVQTDASPYLPPQTVTPSEEQGLTQEQERALRCFGATLI